MAELSNQAEGLELLTLKNNFLEVELLSLGAAIRSLMVPDQAGRPVDVCLGYDDLNQYRELDGCLGGTIGRYANRIAGPFSLGGQTVVPTPNEGANTLHGGAAGFHKKPWQVVRHDAAQATFALNSPHGEEGFPGNLHVEVTYRLAERALTIDYRARSDADTVVSLTNHAYFNLAGQDGGPVDDHLLTVHAQRYTPCGVDNVPTGEIRGVEGTALDLRQGVRLGDRLKAPLFVPTRGLDHNFVLSDGETPAAELFCPQTGVGLRLLTTLPGMQVYTAGFLTPRAGKRGAVYGPGQAVCLEPQFFPDAMHHPHFPSPVLAAGREYRAQICLEFWVGER